MQKASNLFTLWNRPPPMLALFFMKVSLRVNRLKFINVSRSHALTLPCFMRLMSNLNCMETNNNKTCAVMVARSSKARAMTITFCRLMFLFIYLFLFVTLLSRHVIDFLKTSPHHVSTVSISGTSPCSFYQSSAKISGKTPLFCNFPHILCCHGHSLMQMNILNPKQLAHLRSFCQI